MEDDETIANQVITSGRTDYQQQIPINSSQPATPQFAPSYDIEAQYKKIVLQEYWHNKQNDYTILVHVFLSMEMKY